MYLNPKSVFKTVALIALGIAIGIGLMKLQEQYKAPKQTVTITGNGQVEATTDQATISIQATNKDAAQKLKSALLSLGIPESRITQTSYNPPVYDSSSAGPEVMMYPRPWPTAVPSINFVVVIDSLKNIEKVFSTINSVANTQITNTYYSVSNEKTWQNKAKEAALEDARRQVESIAKINNLKVGKLLSVTDNSGPIFRPMLKGTAADQQSTLQKGQANPSTPTDNVYYGEQTVKISASYQAEYELYPSWPF
ncbi:SIMPL domain-containing protein [Patescibacteria group bacterium]|nr:SIMPL domain-containing protein [Patescibacteria group bacterium]